MGTNQMTLLEKLQVTHTSSRAELLESRTPLHGPKQCENTRITFPCCSTCWDGCPRQKGMRIPTSEDPGSWDGSGMVGSVRLFCGRCIGSSAKSNKTAENVLPFLSPRVW